MAGISTIKEAIMICRDSNVTPIIWGHRGLGKSSAVMQLAAQNDWGFIDFRCSQIEASDLRGLPDRGADGRTHFLPPADMPIGDMTNAQIAEELGDVPDKKKFKSDTELLEATRVFEGKLQRLQPRFQKGILFLDELNRAQDDVLQAAFQLVLDRRIGQYSLPPGWGVVVAGNYNEGYQVNGFTDPAFINRFSHLTLSGGETTIEEWVNYISGVYGEKASEVIEFASQNTKHLDGDIAGELGFPIQPSRRSWDMVIRVLESTKSGKYSEHAKTEVLAGLIGRELAITFTRYSCPVKPIDLLTHGVAACKKKLKDLGRNQLTGLLWGMVSFCKNRIEEDKIADVCLDLASWVCDTHPDKDLVVAFARALVGGDSKDTTRVAMISNPKLAQMMARFRKSNNEKKSFIDRLNERPNLQAALSNVAWGSTGANDD